MLIKPINIALFSINISFQIVLGKPLLRIIFMKINSFLRENNSEKGIYRSLKGGFYGFTLLALSLLKSPFSLFTLLSFQPS